MATRKWGPEKLVNTSTLNSQRASDIAVFGSGSFIVVWEDNGAGIDGVIRGQRFDLAGNKFGAEIAISTLAGQTGEQTAPHVTTLADGGFYVGWNDEDPTDHDAVGAVFDAGGKFVRAQDGNSISADDVEDVHVAGLGSGSIAVWTNKTFANNDLDIHFRVFGATGVGNGELTANTATANLQSETTVAVSPDQTTVVIAWQDNVPNTIQGRLFTATGAEFAPQFRIDVPDANALIVSDPVVAWLNNDNFVVVWTQFNSVNVGNNEVKARIFGGQSSPVLALSGNISVNSSIIGNQVTPTVTALPDGGFVVAWEDDSGLGSDSDSAIRLRAFDGAGNKIGGEITVNTTITEGQSQPSIAALPDGRVVVTWTDDSREGFDQSGTSIRMQIVDPRDGIVTGTLSNETLYGIDTVGDEISAGAGNDVLFGLKGNDQLFGGPGLDRLAGGLGDDTLSAGPGNDIVAGGSEQVAVWALLGGIDRLADFSGDGRADIIEISKTGRADVWLSGGTRILNSTLWAPSISQSAKFGDFNGDGKVDLLQLPATSGGAASVSTSTGQANLGFNGSTTWGTGFLPTDKVGDFNGDGKDDVIQLYDPNHTAYVWLANAGGTSFLAFTVWGAGVSSNDKIGDFNGDGKDDVIQLFDGNHTAYVWLSTGTGFQPYTTWGTGVASTDKIGDFNGDGRDDIIQLFDGNHTAYVWLSTGTGFQPYSAWGTGFSSTDKIGDFNGDGRDDIVQLFDGNHTAYVWLSTGTGFQPFSAWATGVRSTDMIGDFNGDHFDDIIQLFEDNGSAYVWLSNGAYFQPYQVWGKGLTVGDSAGDDTYVFAGNYGNDIVTDFQAGAGIHDVIQLDAATWAGFGDVIAHTTDDGAGNTTIAFGGNSILLLHVTKAQLVADDFAFV